MKRITLITALIAAVAIAVGIFYACQKDLLTDGGGIKSHKSSKFYDQELLKKFMEERLVRDFQEVIKSFEIKVNNGILQFRNEEDVNVVYDLLIKYSDEWDRIVVDNSQYAEYVKSEKFPTEPILYAFETSLGFYSLRAYIENQILELEAGDGIPDEGNPDHHFIVSDYMRTLLTPDCEIIAGNIIFLTGRYQDLIILDLDFEKLRKVQSLWKQYGEIDGTLEAFAQLLAHPAPELKAACNCDDITIEGRIDPSVAPITYQFYASIGGTILYTASKSPCEIYSMSWDFGDGVMVNAIAPTHKYNTTGTYTIKVIIIFKDGLSCRVQKTITLDNCSVSISSSVDNSYTGKGKKYNYSATARSFTGATPTSYTWTFEDGSHKYGQKTDFIYESDGNKTVSVRVNFDDGCSASNNKTDSVTETSGKCEKKNAGLSENFCYDANGNPISHDQSIYKLSHFFTTRQCFLWHRIVVENTIYKRKNGKIGKKWERYNAPKMYASFSGRIAKSDDCNLEPINPQGHVKEGNSSQTYDYGVGYKFFVARETLGSEFELYLKNKYTLTDRRTNVLRLHNK
jgi:hypothetical protein